MRPIANFMHHAVLAGALATLSATGAAAAVDAFIWFSDAKAARTGAACTGEGCDDNSQPAVEVLSWSWGATNPSPSAGAVWVAAGDVNGDGRADVAATSDVKSPRDASSGMPTGKRQHKPMTFSKPLDRGSVTVNANVAGCATGKHYDEATLMTLAYKYEFKDVFITSCATAGSGGGGGMPTESVSFNYGKIVMKATTAADKAMWDLKKQEAR